MNKHKPRIAFVIASMRTGGAERAICNLANAFSEKDYEINLVLADKSGELLSSVNSKVQIHDLKNKNARKSVFAFKNFLNKFSPDVLIVAQTHIQLMVLIAVKLSNWKGKIILNEQSTFSFNVKNRIQKLLAFFLFRRADAITFVSHGSATDFSQTFPFLKNKLSVIHNAVFTNDILIKKEDQVNHPFFDDGKIPVIISAGRLIKSKNFIFLLDSFALLLKKTEARLIILGDGVEEENIEKHAEESRISSHVSLPGNADNPFSYFRKSVVFAMTSEYEGLPSVLIEALACGCNIVSTDCPFGPAEILQNGKYGILTPLNDKEKFADALFKNISSERNIESKLNRARDFNSDAISDKYIELIQNISKDE